MKHFLFSICFISLISHLKLSIDIFIMSVWLVIAEFLFIFVKRSCSRLRRQKVHRVCFLNFMKHFVDIECTQIKADHSQFGMVYYSYLYEQKWRHILSCFHWKKCKWSCWHVLVLQSVLQLSRSTQTIGYMPNSRDRPIYRFTDI